ncbi:CdaR family transcriptional regulator [Anaerotruncus rubiinfantis]|uniref:CdaR family transcriptional regulator n=1 Tax=Anaerotruncus rubiinfantis TaxID=1720200 RepID=UPI00189B1531|nr:sugar diacid recognition domain-containing protein [Anaerotruncus rubiinfantis]
MKISRATAMKIVTELESIIHQDINVVDASAHIIAGTTPSRIGTFHGATQKLLSEKLPVLKIYHDEEYEGTRRGINLPLEIEGETVGVIGVTGDCDEVEPYGRIIKKMTEILLLDDYLKEQKSRARNTRNRFVQEWVFGEAHKINQEFFNLGLTMDIDISRARRVLVASASANQRESNYVVSQAVIDSIERVIEKILQEDPPNLSLINGSKFVWLVTDRPDERILELVSLIRREVFTSCGVHLKVGADSLCTSAEQVRDGYRRAEKALWGSRHSTGHGEVTFYDDIGMELFVNDIPEKSRQEFIHKVFRGCSDEEIDQWVSLLSTFFSCNGSIGQTAQKLFLHKNTLQYRLNKLRERTGYDPRNLEDSSLFYIAIVFYESDSGI